MSRRTERIAEQIQSEVANVLRAQASDPRIGLVTITRVDVAPDLSHALARILRVPVPAASEGKPLPLEAAVR